ncbi:uncharacterized protein ANIA_11415 [Aspergillus nidulans FGSC A4]|uniref:Uncharacterized protein n=1 Tax=Emericella nidulans (strain FGSC A4 / ATCC 38163 / CBS 112.46 / NRRL 194 / M139) TaxID=227321 RepID=C8V717_EMENI|nr:hypothetical protein [Aspergillus nidulans FGSC A4]CBF75407.1 TPA: hypothetical protein ANIA_11415 [Aspergillus nidulans FGSC A4]
MYDAVQRTYTCWSGSIDCGLVKFNPLHEALPGS